MRNSLRHLPGSITRRLKTEYYAHNIRSGRFVSREPEYAELGRWVSSGDWVIDIGANVGHYTVALSRLVGPSGRVLAFEPIHETFSHLARNVLEAQATNVSLFNTAASDACQLLSISVPIRSGVKNYYQASVSPSGDQSILGFAVDSLNVPHLSFLKIDAERHEPLVLAGLAETIRRHRPAMVVEKSQGALSALSAFGGHLTYRKNSPNVIVEFES